MLLHTNLGDRSYDIVIKRSLLCCAGEYLDLGRRVCIVSDSGVPSEYISAVAAQCKFPTLVTVPSGEGSKSFESYQRILAEMLEAGFTRKDCVVAIGGGVVGDLAGFVAATYMRGIDFYNIPTTLLSQIDSSIGGKVAVNFGGYKNIVGAFYQPQKVLIDPDVLSSLPTRQISNGLAEAVKMAATFDQSLFELIERGDIPSNIENIIIRSLEIKKSVVERDEKEAGLRKVLNFGHTVGHAIESCSDGGLGSLLHGECVGLGMLCMCSSDVRKRIEGVLKALDLPTEHSCSASMISDAVKHDKKSNGDTISVVYVSKIGSFDIKEISFDELDCHIKGGLGSK